MTGNRQTAIRPAARARSDAAKRAVRQALIDAGSKLIAGEGDTPVSLRQIARYAHYSPAIVYRYFPDKAALMQAIRDALEGLAERIAVLLDEESDARALIFAIANAGFRFASEQSASYGMNILTTARRSAGLPDGSDDPDTAKDISISGARIHALYEKAILRFFAQAGSEPVPVGMAVASFISIITGAVALPSGSNYAALPAREAVLHETVARLLDSWVSPE